MNGLVTRGAYVLAAGLVSGGLLLGGCGGSSGGSGNTSLKTLPKDVTPTTAFDMATTTTTEPKQKVTLTPNAGLADGQTVQVTAKGFKPNAKGLLVLECADKPDSGAGDCEFGHPAVDADASGNVSTTFTVKKGPVGSNKNMCTATQRCVVAVSEPAQNGDNAALQINFAP